MGARRGLRSPPRAAPRSRNVHVPRPPGKYLELAFSPGANAICGARFKTFLLEKSRVAHQAAHERNFHAFYLLLAAQGAASGAALGRRLALRSAAEHLFTKTTPKSLRDDAADFGEFDEVVTALAGEGAREELYGVLAVVLHLGDITFDAAEEKAEPDARGKAALAAAAAALQFGAAALQEKLTQRWIGFGQDEICIPLPPAEAKQVSNAVAKAVYQRLFLHHVGLLNECLTPAALGVSGAARPKMAKRGSLQKALSDLSAKEKVVGLLDIFGFESLQVNGLEQICINLANERLHALFLSYVFQGIPGAPKPLPPLAADQGRNRRLASARRRVAAPPLPPIPPLLRLPTPPVPLARRSAADQSAPRRRRGADRQHRVHRAAAGAAQRRAPPARLPVQGAQGERGLLLPLGQPEAGRLAVPPHAKGVALVQGAREVGLLRAPLCGRRAVRGLAPPISTSTTAISIQPLDVTSSNNPPRRATSSSSTTTRWATRDGWPTAWAARW